MTTEKKQDRPRDEHGQFVSEDEEPIVVQQESDEDRLARMAQEAARAPMAPSVLSGVPPVV